MGNPLKKTMVYLGLADEEEFVDEEFEGAPVHNTAQHREPHREQYREETHDEEKTAPVTPLRRPAVVRQPAADAVNEIVTVHPKQYRDAQTIAEQYRDGLPVIINVSQMSDADARRLIDFASGLVMGLYGRIERVTSKVFLLTPENIAVTGDGGIAPADDASFAG